MSARAVVVLLLPLATGPARAMDTARAEAHVDEAAAKFGVSGKGVLVAVMDRGIDWRNDDFRNDDGSTRIRAILDLTDDRGAAASDNPCKAGTLYSREQIDHALRDGTDLATRDAVGHGTTTTAIACGGGRNSPARKYRGVAPGADILVVKITSDGPPAHDGEPAEAAFWKPELLPVAIAFIRDRAREWRMPCVMILNVGSPGGPTDGTSELCRTIDATTGPGVEGLVLVSGPGDAGGRANRASGTVASGKDVEVTIRKESAAAVFVDLWYADDDRLDASVRTPAGASDVFAAPDAADARETAAGEGFRLFQNAGTSRFGRPSNAKRQLYLELTGPPGDYALVLHARVVKDGRFDATLGPSPPSPTWPPFDRFTSHVVPGAIWDAATARNVICPGDYVVRTQWKDVDGRPQSHDGEGRVGEIWAGSGTGPTFDGRLGVDFCVPCESVFTTYAPRSFWATSRTNLVEDGKGLYGRASAVSAANPFTAGVLALMLEIDPHLDAATAKRLLQESARADAFTGETPNATWGHGKLDALAALGATKANAQRRRR